MPRLMYMREVVLLSAAVVAVCLVDECTTDVVCKSYGQACVDTDKDNTGTWACECIPPQTGAPTTGALAICTDPVGDCHKNGATCSAAGQTCDPGAPFDQQFECKCIPPAQTVTPGQNGAAECKLDECLVKCPTCADKDDGKGNACTSTTGPPQECEDLNTAITSLQDWTCTCKTSTQSAVASAVAVCVEGKDECLEISSAVTCGHKPRYTQDGCLCACDWTAVFKDANGDLITLPPGPGSTEPCASGCCNPQSDPDGDWCYLALHDYNSNKGGVCTARRQTCSAAGTLPQDGGVAVVRDPIAGVPSAQNNVCTDAGQLCVEPDLLTTDDWMCQCVPPMTGTPGQHAIAICVETPRTPTPPTYSPVTQVPAATTPRTPTPPTYSPDTRVPAATTPRTLTPPTYPPDTEVPSTTPLTFTPPTYSPDTRVPAATTPRTLTPSTYSPDTEVPSTAAPRTLTPSTHSPDDTVAPPGFSRVPVTDAPSKTLSPDTQVPSTIAPRTLTPSTHSPDDTAAPPGFSRVPVTDAPGRTLSPDTQVPSTAVPSAVLTATPGDAMLNDTDAPALGAANTSDDTAAPTAQPTTVPDTSPPAGSMSGSAAGAGEVLDAESDGGGSAVGLIVGVVGGVLCLCVAVGGGLWYRHSARESAKFEDVHALENAVTFDDTALYDFEAGDELQAAEEDEAVLL